MALAASAGDSRIWMAPAAVLAMACATWVQFFLVFFEFFVFFFFFSPTSNGQKIGFLFHPDGFWGLPMQDPDPPLDSSGSFGVSKPGLRDRKQSGFSRRFFDFSGSQNNRRYGSSGRSNVKFWKLRNGPKEWAAEWATQILV